MLSVRRSQDRGHFDHGWLNTYHTFSFSEYYDPQWTQFRSLRVMNEDVVAPSRGFGMHGHRDMEIITYVLSGQLEHKDSLGNGGVLTPGELQHMTAGSGIRHSEFNPSADEPVHLYQIWLLPDRQGLPPRYEQTRFPSAETAGQFRLVASPDGSEGSLAVHQDARLYLAMLDPGQKLQHELSRDRHGWLQVLRGAVDFHGESLSAGDGAAISEVDRLEIVAGRSTEVMLFDLA
jgi:redox-sensitive bicupin YhaK (pirin superfamily)